MIVRVEEREGESGVGYGEAAPIPWFGTETVEEIEAACREVGEWVQGERLESIPARLGCLRHAVAVARTNEKSAAVAKSPPGRSLGVAALLPAGRPALTAIAPKLDSGFRFFKWKVGVGDLADELVLLDDVCAALPNGGKLRLDANGAWDRRKAERWLERCADRPVEFVEQPIAYDARGADDLLLGLAADYPTPLALDESLVGRGDIERWIGAGWPGVFVLKPSLIGSVPAALERLARAKADVVFSSALETAVGARSGLRAAFAWAARRHAENPQVASRALGFGVWPLFQDSRFDGPAAAPFVRAQDVQRIDVEAVWNALG